MALIITHLVAFLIGIASGFLSNSLYNDRLQLNTAKQAAKLVMEDAQMGLEDLPQRVGEEPLHCEVEDEMMACPYWKTLEHLLAHPVQRRALRPGQPDLSSLLRAGAKGRQVHELMIKYYEYLENVDHEEREALRKIREYAEGAKNSTELYEYARTVYEVLHQVHEQGLSLAATLGGATERFLK